MGHHNIPSPPSEDQHHHRSSSSRKSHSGSKSKPTHRASKRVSQQIITAAQQQSHSEQNSPTSAVSDGRHKRVWKACERCRMKKTKCDGEFPCKRCKDDGLVCTAGVRKKTEYKQLPRGYAEVLESTQFALISTIHKLYSMVRNEERWELGDPMLNDRGQPIVHNIASKLGCIRPNSDIDLPVHSVFPEDEAGLEELVRQLNEQETQREVTRTTTRSGDSSCNRTDRDSSSELDHSEFEDDYRRKATLSSKTASRNNGMGLLSPQSLPPYRDFEIEQATSLFPGQGMQDFAWDRTASMDFLEQPPASYSSMDMLNQGLLESEFGTLKPHVVSCPNPEVMMGMGDPMMYAGYEDETMRL